MGANSVERGRQGKNKKPNGAVVTFSLPWRHNAHWRICGGVWIISATTVTLLVLCILCVYASRWTQCSRGKSTHTLKRMKRKRVGRMIGF